MVPSCVGQYFETLGGEHVIVDGEVSIMEYPACKTVNRVNSTVIT